MVYSKQTWVDGDRTKPLSAARLNKLETQYDEAKAYADGVISNVSGGSNEITAGYVTAGGATKTALDSAYATQAALTAQSQKALQGGATGDADIAFAVVDKDNRRTWIEAGADGKPTTRAAGLIADAVTPAVGAAVGVPTQSDLASDLAFAVTDVNGRRTDLEIGRDGHFTARVIALLSARINATLGTPENSGPALLGVGHSMLAGAGSAIASAMPARSYTSVAVGGEPIETISARWGSHPTVLSLAGGNLPASGAVSVTFGADVGTPFVQGPSSYTGYLLLADGTKIPGTLAGPSGSATFTRTTSGAAVTIARPVVFVYDIAETHRSDIVIFWAGRNGDWTLTNAARDRLDRLEGMIRHQKALNRRYLVLSEHIQSATTSYPTSDAAAAATAIADYNRQAYLRWGSSFIDTQAYLIAYGLSDRGLTATSDDNTDIAAGRVPRQLRSDQLHLTADGSAVVASLIARRILEKGWA